MKNIIAAALLLATAGTVSAQNFMTRTGKISFNATVPKSPDKVEAVNNEVATIVNANGTIVFQVLVKSFKFEKALMQEHFNENYMESDKFPKSEFKGNIVNIGDMNLTKDGDYPATVKGKLTIHGVTKEVSVPGSITVKGKNIRLKAKFAVALKEYGIKIPDLVADKLAKEAQIALECDLAQK